MEVNLDGLLIEPYPFGLDSLIILSQGDTQYSWQNISKLPNETYSFIAYRNATRGDAYRVSSDELPFGRYIDNEGYYGHSSLSVMWQALGGAIVAIGELVTEKVVQNVTLSGPAVVLRNFTSDIPEFYVRTPVPNNDGNETFGPVLVNGLGSEDNPLDTLNLRASQLILAGHSSILYSRIETFNPGDSSAISPSGGSNICDIDLSRSQSFVGVDITLIPNGEEGCISIGGIFFARLSLIVLGKEVIQAGLLGSNGTAAFDVEQLTVNGEIAINDNVTFIGGPLFAQNNSSQLSFTSNSSIRSNQDIVILSYKTVALHGTSDAQSIKVEATNFNQGANSSTTTGLFTFIGNSSEFCGNLTITELRSDANYTKICETAIGIIEKLYVTGDFYHSGALIRIGQAIISNASVHLLTNTNFGSLVLGNASLDNRGKLYAVNMTASLRGSVVINHPITALNMILNVTDDVINNATILGLTASFIANSYINEAQGHLTINNTASFTLRDDFALRPGSSVQLGSITLETNSFLNKGGRLIIRGMDTSFISTTSFINEIEFYKTLPAISCATIHHNWICGRIRNSAIDRFFGGGSYENISCNGACICSEEQHSYGLKAATSINGKLNLNATQITVYLSDVWIKDLNLTKATIAPKIDSKSIYRTYSVSGRVPGGACGEAQVIDEVSSSFLFENITCSIEGGLLINWQGLGSNQLATSTALVPADFSDMQVAHYTPPVLVRQRFDIRHLLADSANIYSRLLRPLIPTKLETIEISNDGYLDILPLLISPSFSVICDDIDGQDQLDCEQYSFLKKLGFLGAVPTQADFGIWENMVSHFIYQQTSFHLIKIIAQYGSSLSMLRDFAAIALNEYESIGLIPGHSATQEQIEQLTGPIVWPVWTDSCMSKDENGNLFLVGIRCLSYELYIPRDYFMDQIQGAIFGGKNMDITITGTTIIGPGGKLIQFDTEVEAAISHVDNGKASITITDGGDLIQFGLVEGRIALNIETGNYIKLGGITIGSGQMSIVAESVYELPLEQDGRIISQPKTILLCEEDKNDCLYHQESTKGDTIRKTAEAVIDGNLVMKSARDLKEETLHAQSQRTCFIKNGYVSEPVFTTFRSKSYVTGSAFLAAQGVYYAKGTALYVEKGGEIYGGHGTKVEAITSYGSYHKETIKDRTFSTTVTTTNALASHTTPIEMQAGDPIYPIRLGMKDSPTHVEGIVADGPRGPGIIFLGETIEVTPHKIREFVQITSKTTGLLVVNSRFKPDLRNIPGLRQVDSIKHKDWLGFTTGMITDVVGSYSTYSAIKGSDLMKDMPMAGGVAALLTLLSDSIHIGASFGKQVTVITPEGITSMPNVIGNSIEEGFVGFYSSGDVRIEHTEVNAKKIEVIIAGHLTLTKGTDQQSTTMKQSRKAFEFNLSLSSISAGVGVSSGSNEQRIETHHKSFFHGSNVTFMVDEGLTLQGAVIDGKVVRIDGDVTIEDVVDKVRSREKFQQADIGIAFNFWTGVLSPYASVRVGRDVQDSDLVRFISQITGQNVEITAEKITASLDAITGQEQLQVLAKERIVTDRPAPKFHHQAWSIGASVSIGKDGKFNPSITPSFTEDGRRISAVISADLFRGLNAIANTVTGNYAQQEKELKDTLGKSSKGQIDGFIDGRDYLTNNQKRSIKEEGHNDLNGAINEDSSVNNKGYKLQNDAKNEGAKAEPSLASRIGSFLGNLFKPKEIKQQSAYDALTAEDKLILAQILQSTYGMTQMISRMDSPVELKEKVEYLVSRLPSASMPIPHKNEKPKPESKQQEDAKSNKDKGTKKLSFEEFKKLKEREISSILSPRADYLVEKGFSYIEASIMEPASLSGPKVNSYLEAKYQNYLAGLGPDAIHFSTAGLQGHLFSKAIVTIKHKAQGNFPDQTRAVGRVFDAASNFMGFLVEGGLKEMDLYLDFWLTPVGNAYLKSFLKEQLKPVALAINDYARDLTPETREVFKDAFQLTDLIAAGRIVKTSATLATNAAIKGTEKLAATALVQDMKQTTNNAKRIAVTPEGMGVEFVDDITASGSNVLTDTKLDIKGAGTIVKGLDDASFNDLFKQGKIIYKDSPKHHINVGGKISTSPKDSSVIKDSIQIKDTSPRRIAIDRNNDEFVVFDRILAHADGTVEYHGYTSNWEQLAQEAKNILRDNGLVRRDGSIKGLK
jgi:hypothetical protein